MVENKVTLSWSRNKQDTKRRQLERSEGQRETRITLELIYCGLFPGSVTAGCLTSRLTEIVIGLMNVLSTRLNILLKDYSQLALTRSLKSQVCMPND